MNTLTCIVKTNAPAFRKERIIALLGCGIVRDLDVDTVFIFVCDELHQRINRISVDSVLYRIFDKRLDSQCRQSEIRTGKVVFHAEYFVMVSILD